MADAADSKSAAFTGVWVQVPPPAPSFVRKNSDVTSSSRSGPFMFSPMLPDRLTATLQTRARSVPVRAYSA